MRNVGTIISWVSTEFLEEVKMIITIEQLIPGIPALSNLENFQVCLVKDDDNLFLFLHFFSRLEQKKFQVATRARVRRAYDYHILHR